VSLIFKWCTFNDICETTLKIWIWSYKPYLITPFASQHDLITEGNMSDKSQGHKSQSFTVRIDGLIFSYKKSSPYNIQSVIILCKPCVVYLVIITIVHNIIRNETLWSPTCVMFWSYVDRTSNESIIILYILIGGALLQSIYSKAERWAAKYMCVRDVDVDSVSAIFLLKFETVSTVWFLFVLHFIWFTLHVTVCIKKENKYAINIPDNLFEIKCHIFRYYQR
jgi:hypothetical protein